MALLKQKTLPPLKCLHCETPAVKNPWPNTIITRVQCDKCGEWNEIEWVSEGQLAKSSVCTTKVPPLH